MSDLRIALVAEGPTDRAMIEAALKAILPTPFILTLLQPEPTRPWLGTGWCGVFKWCLDFAKGHWRSLEEDPRLFNFDAYIIHLDADVAGMAYSDCGEVAVRASLNLPPLPCARPCPPPLDTVLELQTRMLGWLGIRELGARTVFCIPSKSMESWLVPALLPADHPLFGNLECQSNMDVELAQLPLKQRIRKSLLEYQSRAAIVTRRWPEIRQVCTQAEAFHDSVAQWSKS